MAGSTTNYNSSVDVYSFGIILSELLVWRNAYHNVVVKSLFKLRDMVCFQELRPTIPERLVKASPIVASLGTLQKHSLLCLPLPGAHQLRVSTYVHTAAIARQCWAPHPSQRPGFASLVPRFEELAAKLAARRHTRHDDIPTHSGSGRDGFVGSGTSIAWDDSLDGTSQRQPSTSAAVGAAGAGGASARRRGDKPRAVSALAATLHANGMDGSSIGKPHAGAGAGLGAGAST